ncbi:hypothetical protein INR49_024960 [Caranx melampygus]|nr:hypothetical protein INR49_024960 [Caranx melampygus]
MGNGDPKDLYLLRPLQPLPCEAELRTLPAPPQDAAPYSIPVSPSSPHKQKAPISRAPDSSPVCSQLLLLAPETEDHLLVTNYKVGSGSTMRPRAAKELNSPERAEKESEGEGNKEWRVWAGPGTSWTVKCPTRAQREKKLSTFLPCPEIRSNRH